MNLTGEYRIAAPRDQVWQALNDPEILAACIPGCQSFKMLSATDIDAQIVAQLGPVKATFASRIALTQVNPPQSYTLNGEGKGGAAGFGKGEATVTLQEGDGVTVLRYVADMKVGGKLAQIGSRLIEGAAKSMTDEFFSRFALRLDQSAQRVEPALPTASAHAAPAARLRATIVLGLLALGALLWWLLG